MYTEDGHSVTMMVNGPVVNQPRDDKRYGGFFAFDPTREGIPPVAAFGRECAGFDLAAIRHDYKVVVQNYRLLDCEAHAISWKDPKVVSAAAIGIGKDGDVVFIHTRTAHTMTELATILGMPALSLAHAHYVEGGPEASLYVHAGNRTIRAIGQYTGAFADDVSQQLWELPNVIGFSPR